MWKEGTAPHSRTVVGVSCHSAAEVGEAEQQHADFAVFAPVFEKKDAPSVHPARLEALRQVCRHKIPVLALGGVTSDNARACLHAGAAGIAAIRLFQDNDVAEVVAKLRALRNT
jgi:thiamine-phosphate pyrophosphorylase